MNKYQEMYLKLLSTFNNIQLGINNHNTLEITQHFNTLRELVDKTKTPTLEEVKTEWEELGYKVLVSNDYTLILRNIDKGVEIYIEKLNKNYGKYDTGSCVYESFTLQEHDLITKTFKALEVKDEH